MPNPPNAFDAYISFSYLVIATFVLPCVVWWYVQFLIFWVGLHILKVFLAHKCTITNLSVQPALNQIMIFSLFVWIFSFWIAFVVIFKPYFSNNVFIFAYLFLIKKIHIYFSLIIFGRIFLLPAYICPKRAVQLL